MDWYILDNVLKPEERINHLLNLDWSNPPIYAKPLVIYSKESKPMYILGSRKIYNDKKQLIEPVGEERDLYNKWLSNAKAKYIKTKEKIFASMKDDVLMFNIENDTPEIKIMVREKSISGRSCITLHESVTRNIIRWLTGEDAPESVKGKSKLCLYLDLVIRRAIVQEKDDIIWITPQEYDIINNEPDNKKDVLKRMK